MESVLRPNPDAYNIYSDFLKALQNNNVVEVEVCSLVAEKKLRMTPEDLATKWCISLPAAKKTLKCTTQRGVRTYVHPFLNRRFQTNDRAFRYRRLKTDLYTDTMFAKTKSWHRGNSCAQIYGAKNGWCQAYPMKSKSEARDTLRLLCKHEGAPDIMVMNGAKEQTQENFTKFCRQA